MRINSGKETPFLTLSPLAAIGFRSDDPLAPVSDSGLFRRLLVAATGVLVIFVGSYAEATYNANLTGNIISLATYDNGEVLVILNNQPASNGACTPTFFELDPPGVTGSTVASDAAFNRMYARLAQAFATGDPVTLGYDNAGNCGFGGYIRVYRTG